MNETPGINLFDGVNPTITSPYSPFSLPFYQTRETLIDIEVYQKFISNATKQFRRTKVYTHYKGFLMQLGMDRCQLHYNITSEMAELEMHHNMITIYDIAIIITEHILNTKGYITTFDLVHLLREVHTKHKVQLVMLSLTTHQALHNTDEVFIHPDMCVGKWWEFLEEYKTGITPDIGRKIITALNKAIDLGASTDGELSKIRDRIKDWSGYNECNECKCLPNDSMYY